MAHTAADGGYPYLVSDARYEKVRRGGSVISQGVLVGISATGYREVLGGRVGVGNQLGRGLQ